MIAKISVGKGLRGSLNYDFALGKNGQQRARLIAGTLAGTPRQMSSQAAPFRALRPETRNPVWRCSLSLPPAERLLSDSEWKKIAEDFLIEMGVETDKSAWVAVRHSDKAHSHIHISLLRIQSDGKLWDRAQDVRRAIAATVRLEQRYGLLSHHRERAPGTPKPTPTSQPPKKKGKKMSVISKIQSEVDVVLTAAGIGGVTLGELKKRLLAKQILLEEARTKQGKIMGLRYQNDGGAWISASQIGSEYGLGLAARGVDFGDQIPPKSTPAAAATDSKDKTDSKPSEPSNLDRLSDWLEGGDLANLDPLAKPKSKATPKPAAPLRLSGHWFADVAILVNRIQFGVALALLSYLKRCLSAEDIALQVEVEKRTEQTPWGVPAEKITVKRLEITDTEGLFLDEERALKVDQIVSQTLAAVQSLDSQKLPEKASEEAENLIDEIEKEKLSVEIDMIEEAQSKLRTTHPEGTDLHTTITQSLLKILDALIKKLLLIAQRDPVPEPYILGLNTARVEIDTALRGQADDPASVNHKGLFFSQQIRDHWQAKNDSKLKKFIAENPPIVHSDPLDRDDDEQEESYQPRM